MLKLRTVRVLALWLGRLNAGVERLARTIGALAVAFAVSGLALGALLRFTIGSASDLLVDLPPALMPWMVMLLLAPLARRGLHVTVDVLPTLIAPRWLPALRLLAWIVVGTASVVFALGSAGAVLFFARMGETAAMSVDIPLWWFYLAFPVGFALLAVVALEMLLRELAGLAPLSADGHDDWGAR